MEENCNDNGRPRKELNREDFEKCCAIQATLNEVACFFDCSPDTVERWCKREYGITFADVFAQKRGVGTMSIRRRQFDLASKGDKTMLIWLGKQLLGQSDKQDTNLTATQQVTFVDDITELNADTD